MRGVTPALRAFLLEVQADEGPCLKGSGYQLQPGEEWAPEPDEFPIHLVDEAIERRLVDEYICPCGLEHHNLLPLGRMALALPTSEAATRRSV